MTPSPPALKLPIPVLNQHQWTTECVYHFCATLYWRLKVYSLKFSLKSLLIFLLSFCIHIYKKQKQKNGGGFSGDGYRWMAFNEMNFRFGILFIARGDQFTAGEQTARVRCRANTESSLKVVLLCKQSAHFHFLIFISEPSMPWACSQGGNCCAWSKYIKIDLRHIYKEPARYGKYQQKYLRQSASNKKKVLVCIMRPPLL